MIKFEGLGICSSNMNQRYLNGLEHSVKTLRYQNDHVAFLLVKIRVEMVHFGGFTCNYDISASFLRIKMLERKNEICASPQSFTLLHVLVIMAGT